MRGMTRGILAALLLATAACGSTGRTAPMAGGPGEDVVRLTNGETVRGRIVEEDGRRVLVERDDRVLALPRGAVYSIEYSRESFARASAPELKAPEVPAGPPRPSSSWDPRASASDPVQASEVLWFDGHPVEDCVGAATAQSLRELPDLKLFVEPGGRLVLHDPRRWGYHAHLQPGGFHRPGDRPGLSIDLPREEGALPPALTFVSPAQELKSGDRASFTPPDALHALLRPASEADAALAVQPFSGGRPSATRNGTLWAFTLPRNARQFCVWLFDGRRQHGEILKASFAAYGDTLLAPDLILDSAAADGTLVGRVLVVPYPEGVAADGPAPDAVTLWSGPTQDPSEIVRLPLPPRTALQLPAGPVATRATVLVSHFEVSPTLPQSSVVAWGLGRPSGEVRLTAGALTSKEADQLVKMDLSSLPEDRFPAVAWLSQRRIYAWRSAGGRLPDVEPLRVPGRRGPVRVDKVKRSEGVPHVVPLLFQGPKPAVGGSRAGEGALRVAGGMSEALLTDALLRDSGGSSAPAPAPGNGSYSNVTNLTVVVPPHDPSGGLMSAPLTSSPPGGMYLSRTPGWGGPAPLVNPRTGQAAGNPGVFGHVRGVEEGGVFRDSTGSVLYDPASGETRSTERRSR